MSGVYVRITGEGMTLSASYEAIISAELPFVDVARFGEISEVGDCPAPRKLLVIEEQVFWSDPDNTLQQFDRLKDWHIVLAYSDADIAARFYATVCERKDFGRFSCLPMNVQLDCWIAIFRILVMGQGYLPALSLSL